MRIPLPDDLPTTPGETVQVHLIVTLVDATYGQAAKYAVDQNLLTGQTFHTGAPGHENDFTIEIAETKVTWIDRDIDPPGDMLTGVGTSDHCFGLDINFYLTRN